MRSYQFLSRYPDKNYTEKFKRWAKIVGYVLLVIFMFAVMYVGLGAEQSYGGGLRDSLKGRLGAVTQCIKNSDAITWKPSTDPSFISHYLVFAARKPSRINSVSDLQGKTPIGKTKEQEFKLPRKYRKSLYFYTVQAVSYGGLKSTPAKPISCLQKGQGR